ncbi:Release factor glutamine methyltransferase [Methanimicrococcus hongohii]|uniref:Release factor glutamine methyltransferase n=1 Tax=Methanimicrococcus hongohii TaxID=3028295 RepID=A0AA96ZTF3_9EURY|nr:HemK2/MTQ2 family protein methyltransferase [Methanimicrococcus sp. Hf6]WNY24454.1 Release factor glutamine methyltransferase [Methanimicrococcus sp. Hf6]
MSDETVDGKQPVIVTKVEYKGTKVSVLEDVYEPAEDTFLMADCAVSEIAKLIPESNDDALFEKIVNIENDDDEKIGNAGLGNTDGVGKIKNFDAFDFFDNFFAFEVGCGSGFVSAFIQNRFPDLHVSAVDINPNAVACARMNGVRAFESDMFGVFEKPRHLRSIDTPVEDAAPAKPPLGFDLIIFNPPYLPTSEDEKVSGMLNYAFDGGVDGRESINRFLNEVGDYLKDGGFFLLLISSITGLDETAAEMENCGFSTEVIGTTKCSFEELMVLKGKRLSES